MLGRTRAPNGSRSNTAMRRTGTIAVAALSMAALYAVPANAVHDEGKFQLDGDAQTSADSSPTALEDWDKVCPANSPANRPVGDSVRCLGGTTAQRSAFIVDAFLSASDNIFKGGTDDADVSTWQWKQAGPSPDKDDIEHAYAAQYIVNSHKLLYFGGDRLANNGNTNIGFWFFHNPVTTAGSRSTTANDVTSCSFASGCGFSGTHTVGDVSLGGDVPGDIFILSAFTNGGAQPTIKLFEWVGPGNATKNYLGSNNCFTSACTLQPLAIPNTPGFNDNRCGGATVTGDVGCALVNGTSKPSPWIFTDKTSGAPANTFGPSEFYEGGLDLTDLGFGDACFSSALLNTRSSQSGTSVLQDFALGSFGSCTSSVVTTPSVGSGGASIGTGSVSVTDSAVVDVQGVSSFNGSLNFHLCGPLSSPTANCQTGGTAVDAAAGVNPVTANGTYNSASVTVTSAGRYCWRANFTSTTTGVPAASDPSDATNLSECFTINPVTPALDTAAVASPVNFGQAVQDNATLTETSTQPGDPIIGGSPGAAAGGTIQFTLLKSDCSTLATGTGTNPQSVNVSGNGTYGPVSFTPDAPGTYHWKAVYTPATGDPNNLGSTHNGSCNDTDETVVVNQVPTGISTRQWVYPNDKAVITASGGGNLAGSVAFKLYGATGGGTPKTALENCQANGDVVGSGGLLYKPAAQNISGASPQSAGTSNSSVAVTADSTVVWRVTYTSTNQAQLGSSSACVESTAVDFSGDDGNISVP
jgi:hypothetical protein